MSSNSSPPPAPNYQPIADAESANAKLSAQIAQEQLDWAKQVYSDNKPITDQVVQGFLDTQNFNTKAAEDDRARYVSEYQPLEDSLVNDANTYNSPAKRDLEMGRAQSAVGQSFDTARLNSTRDLESYGINPSATRYGALDVGLRANEAAAKAAAGNQAGLATDATGRALRSEAINVGRGYPGQVAGTFGTANNAGSGAVNSENSTTQTASNSMGNPTSWMGESNQALQGWTSALNAGFNNANTSFTSGQNSSTGLGALAGFGMSAMSKMPFMFAADGGAIPDMDHPGPEGAVPVGMSPSRGKAVDDVPTRLTVGEFVVPKDVTSWLGEQHMHKLIGKAREDRHKITKQTGAVPTMHPATMAAMANHRPAALPVR